MCTINFECPHCGEHQESEDLKHLNLPMEWCCEFCDGEFIIDIVIDLGV